MKKIRKWKMYSSSKSRRPQVFLEKKLRDGVELYVYLY